ncbi:GNAT family N-acetyltransferase [Kosakonia sp. BK9b]|uniref:GNAT family N-acetyltransferase n=1 Tax=Kosakonia sp. TaxID=1916651 RepID=UPI00289D554E|nr:GNAT family N-acetyltransferase [Kosakonia sp.]
MELATITLEQCLDIRHAVLWPQREREASRVEGDEQASHYGVIAQQEIVSCLSVFLRGDRHCQIRKFATLQHKQQQGFGHFLFQSVLEKLAQEGIASVQLNARASAVSFYTRFGFIAESAPFHQHGMAYIRMGRKL